jgi:amino acid adenylation domain-containing protein
MNDIPLIHELVDEVTARMPDQTAVVFRSRSLTYRDLSARTTQLAQFLRHHRVGAETLVAIGLGRSIAYVEAVLGVLKSGGAFVPVVPDLPPARIDFILKDTKTALLITESRYRHLFAGFMGTLILLDADWPTICEASLVEPGPSVRPDNLAYVMYTSGSTGEPKGVMVEHEGLPNLAWAQNQIFGIHPGSRVLQFASPCFDASISEIFTTLAAGATLCIPDLEQASPTEALSRLLAGPGYTVATFPPSLIPFLEDEHLESLATLVVAGEACTEAILTRWLPRLRIVNAYGPTEGTVCASTFHLDGKHPAATIGQALPQVALHVLDGSMLPVAPGAVGELYLEGLGLARGYLNRPELDELAFLPHPDGKPGRIYRTGDRVRLLPDGNLEYVGRVDGQVKIRGCRVEPAEVEAVMRQHPAVQEAVALPVEVPGEGKRLVAFAVPRRTDTLVQVSELRRFLEDRLPPYLRPSHLSLIDSVPLTLQGKRDQARLLALHAQDLVAPPPPAPAGIGDQVAGIWASLLGEGALRGSDRFFDRGGTSLTALRLCSVLKERLGVAIQVSDLFRRPTLEGFSRLVEARLASPHETAQEAASGPRGEADAIAVVGMACYFPGAETPTRFWRNLMEGKESIQPAEDLPSGAGNRVNAGAFIPRFRCFDADFFGFTPREAALMDPQHRLLLECAWKALEDSGCDPFAFPGTIGIFAGAGTNDYLFSNLIPQPDLVKDLNDFPIYVANQGDCLATRIAHRLDFRGPAVTVQTACSTSLVAVHLACQSLHSGDADLALAGAARIAVPHFRGYARQEGGILSHDGKCRPFDAGATGTVMGNGVGVVVLKRLGDAVRDGDPIRAVILGSAVNNDGMGRMNYSSPGVEGQEALLRAAYRNAGVDPATIGYVEAHGTGTSVGDPIEFSALAQAFRHPGMQPESCGLGSVKSNLGHLGVAAGVASLIKVVLALEHGQLPPTLHFQQANPHIPLKGSPFHVVAGARAWAAPCGKRRAGVSSFGLGGTNAHVVLEAWEGSRPVIGPGPESGPHLFCLSAKTQAGLHQMAKDLLAFMDETPDARAQDIAFTLGRGRVHYPIRKAFVAFTREDFQVLLARFLLEDGEGDSPPAPSDLLERARHWELGEAVDLAPAFEGAGGRRIPLPTYPFARTEHWIQGPEDAPASIPCDQPREAPASVDLASAVLRMVQDVTGNPVAPSDDLFSAGLDSFLVLELLAKIEDAIGLKLSPPEVFSNPTPQGLAEVLQAKLHQPGDTGWPGPSRPPVPVQHLLPAQRQFWVAEQLDPGCPAHNVPVTFEITGPLAIGTLDRALAALVEDQPALRSIVEAPDGIPVLRLAPSAGSGLDYLPAFPDRASALASLTAECRKGFDLTRGPGARAILVPFGPDHHLFGWVVHHAWVDGHSMALLVRELSHYYQTLLAHPDIRPEPLLAPAGLGPATSPEGRDLEAHRAFWTNLLEGAPEVCGLLPDFQGPATFRKPVRRLPFALPAERFHKLRALARTAQTTLFNVLLSSWTLFLHRYADLDDLLTAFPLNQRDHRESAQAIGPLIRSLPFRMKPPQDASFLEWVRQVAGITGRIRAHGEATYAEIIQWYMEASGRDEAPALGTFFVYQDLPPLALDLPGCTSTPFEVDLGAAQHDVTLVLAPEPAALSGVMEYNTDLFRGETMEAALRAFLCLLEGVAADPDLPISQYRLQGEAEARERLAPPSGIADEPTATFHSLVRLFERQVDMAPNALALTCGRSTLTYAQLNQRVNSLAQGLLELGIQPGDRVLVQARREVETVVAMLTLLKVRAVYVPVAPDLPEVRLRAIEAAIQPRLRLPLSPGTLPSRSAGNPGLEAKPEDPVYILHTSGSNGSPKGVVVPHRGIANTIRWRIRAFDIGPKDRLLHTMSFSFDPSIWQVLGPLCAGARVRLAEQDTLMDVEGLGGVIHEEGITLLDFTPTLLRTFLEVADPSQVAGVRVVFSGGEALDPSLCRRFPAVFIAARLYNMYGPTETSIDATFWQADPDHLGPRLPIGRPIAGAEVHILDGQLCPCPVGAVGEICIGGPGLALGYWNDPALTGERFVEAALPGLPSIQIYRTGDRGRLLPDGCFEFLGRRDLQVKLHGQRLDLQDIEVNARLLDGIEHAVAVLERLEGPSSLVLYLEPKAGQELAWEQIYEFLAKRLPGYMVPGRFRLLTPFPRTSSGKLARTGLDRHPFQELQPRPAGTSPAGLPEPLTGAEGQLLDIFREVLPGSREQITPATHFFAAGGTSMLAIQVVSRIRRQIGVGLPPSSIYRFPTVAALAPHLMAREWEAVPEPAGDSGEGFPLSRSQQVVWWMGDGDRPSTWNHVPIFMEFRGTLEVPRLARALATLARRHAALSTVFVARGRAVYQKPGKGRVPALQVVPIPEAKTLLTAQEFADHPSVREFLSLPFELTVDAPFRAAVWLHGNHQAFVVLCLHKLVYDGHTDVLLGEEINRLYGSGGGGDDREEPVPYATFVAHEAAHLVTPDEPRLEAALQRWRTCDPGPGPAASRVQHPEPADVTTVRTTLGPLALEPAERLAQQHGTTLFLVLLALVRRSLALSFGRCIKRVAIPLLNRPDEKFLQTVGRFVDLAFLPLACDPEAPLEAVLQDNLDVMASAVSLNDYWDHMARNGRRFDQIVMPEILFNFMDLRRTGDTRGTAGFVRIEPVQTSLEFPISLEAFRHAGGLDLTCHFTRPQGGPGLDVLPAHLSNELRAIGDQTGGTLAIPDR